MAPEQPINITRPTELQSFLEAAPDAIVAVDFAGRIVLTNALTEKMFGYSRRELVGAPIELLVPERYHAAHVQQRARYSAQPRTRPMGEGRALAGRRKDGSEFAVEISLAPLETDRGALVISIIRDTTARRQAEAKFRGLLESAPDGMVVVDARGTIVLVNTQVERIFGYPRDELVGKSIELLVPERFRAAHVGQRNSFFVAPKTRPMGGAALSLAGRRKDGSEVPVEISLSPMHTDDGLLVTAAVRDVTDRKKVEAKLRASLDEKVVLLKEVHHRVKNNLQIVSSMLNLQMEQIRDSEALALFQESHARVRSIALFHEKLYQSKDLAHVDMAEYLKGLISGLFATFGVSTDITPTVDAEHVPMSVDAAISCGLIVNELVSNSLKYAFPKGRHGEVHVALRRAGEDAVLEVRDNGVGIPPDINFRNPSSLGLRLVCILTDQVRGTIELDTEGPGTRFIVRFDPGEHTP